MRTQSLLSRIAVASALITLLASLGSSVALAQTNSASTGLAVSPLIWETTANPGETVSTDITIENRTTTAQKVSIDTRDVTVNGEDGQSELQRKTETSTVANWLTVTPANSTIQPREVLTFKATLTVPQSPPPGAQYGAVVFVSNELTPANAPIKVTPEVSMLVLLRLPGDESISGQIDSLHTGTVASSQNSDTTVSFKRKGFFISGPITFQTRFENTGNVHVVPKGQISIENMRGKSAGLIPLYKTDPRNVKRTMPGTVRRYYSTWKPSGWHFGRYTATAYAEYGDDDSQVSSTSVTFWIIPIYMIIVGAVLLLLVVFLIARRLRRRHS